MKVNLADKVSQLQTWLLVLAAVEEERWAEGGFQWQRLKRPFNNLAELQTLLSWYNVMSDVRIGVDQNKLTLRGRIPIHDGQ